MSFCTPRTSVFYQKTDGSLAMYHLHKEHEWSINSFLNCIEIPMYLLFLIIFSLTEISTCLYNIIGYLNDIHCFLFCIQISLVIFTSRYFKQFPTPNIFFEENTYGKVFSHLKITCRVILKYQTKFINSQKHSFLEDFWVIQVDPMVLWNIVVELFHKRVFEGSFVTNS